MVRRTASSDEPGLFDLPLRPQQPASSADLDSTQPPAATQILIDLEEPPSLFPALADDISSGSPQQNETASSDQGKRVYAPFKGRLVAGLFDLGLILLVGAFCILSVGLLGANARVVSWPPFSLFLLSFSFLYHVIPLSFWGKTPGMAVAGLIARNADELPLSIGQTGLRWIGMILTLALIGLPAVLMFTGASLTDRISGSRTFAPAANT